MSILTTVWAPRLRDQMERLAYWRLLGEIDAEMAVRILDVLQGGGMLAADDPHAHFAALVSAIRVRDGGDETAQARVDAALDELTGEK